MKNLSLAFIALIFFAFTACNEAQEPDNTDQTDTTQTDTPKPEEKPTAVGYQIGDAVADFSLKNISGDDFNLSGYDAATKGAIVVFTCNTCPYVHKYEDRIIELNKKYADKGYPVVAINPNDPEVKEGDSFEAMKERAKELGFDFPYLLDEGQKVYPLFAAKKTPEIFLLTRQEDNSFKLAYTGAIDNDVEGTHEDKRVRYVENAISALEKGETPEPTVTKAVGCSIKVKKTEEG